MSTSDKISRKVEAVRLKKLKKEEEDRAFIKKNIVNCSECKKSVSFLSKICLNCGTPTPRKTRRIIDYSSIIGTAILLFLFIVPTIFFGIQIAVDTTPLSGIIWVPLTGLFAFITLITGISLITSIANRWDRKRYLIKLSKKMEITGTEEME